VALGNINRVSAALVCHQVLDLAGAPNGKHAPQMRMLRFCLHAP
jgi:hypothetical protein